MKSITWQLRNALKERRINMDNVSIRNSGKWHKYNIIITASCDDYEAIEDYYKYENQIINYLDIRYDYSYLLDADFYNQVEDIICRLNITVAEIEETEDICDLELEYFIKTE